MPWIYQQSTGNFYHDENFIQQGYAGRGVHKNKPASQGIQNFGPIPRGKWRIGGYTSSKGPLTITLTPMPGTNTFGRSAFRIHGDSISNPGSASHGCIILWRSNREKIVNSIDKELEVIE